MVPTVARASPADFIAHSEAFGVVGLIWPNSGAFEPDFIAHSEASSVVGPIWPNSGAFEPDFIAHSEAGTPRAPDAFAPQRERPYAARPFPSE